MTFAERCALLEGALAPRAIAHGAGRWLTPALVPTDASRARLRRWAAAGGPAPDRSAVCVAGPEDVLGLADTVLARLPDPVADHVVSNVAIAGVGRAAAGWAWCLPALPAPTEAPQLVVIDTGVAADELEALLAHEIAHCWLSHPVRPLGAPVPMPADVRAAASRLDAFVASTGLPDPRLPHVARDEYRVAALACEWGFVGQAADTDSTARALLRAQERNRV